MIEYVDPTTGRPVYKTMTFFMQMLRPGETHAAVEAKREPASCAPFEGRGYSVIGGKRLDWEPFDTFVVPGGTWCEHVNALGPASRPFLFVASDEPTLKALDALSEAWSRTTQATSCASSDLADRGGQARFARRCDAHIPVRVGHVAKFNNAAPRSHPTARAAARCGSTAQLSTSATCASPPARPIVDIADPPQPTVIARIEMPPGWHSHKVRVANGLMVVNHERQGQGGDPNFGGGLGDLRCLDARASRS